MTPRVLDEHVETASGQVSVRTMHLAKGLEFRAVVAMACDDEIIPLQERIETVGDDANLEEVYNTERQSLYVACTRARDHLLVTSIEPSSEFLATCARDHFGLAGGPVAVRNPSKPQTPSWVCRLRRGLEGVNRAQASVRGASFGCGDAQNPSRVCLVRRAWTE